MKCVRQVLEFEENGEQRSTCANERIVLGDMRHARVFYGTFFAFGFVVPLVAVCLLYGAMVRRLLTKSVAGARKTGKQSETSRAKRRVTRLVVIVVVIFAACWLPMQVHLYSTKYLSIRALAYCIALRD